MNVFYNEVLTIVNCGMSPIREDVDGVPVMAMIECNKKYIRRCAENILNDFTDVQEQIRLLKDLRGVAESMVEAEQKLVIQQVAISEAESSLRQLREKYENGEITVNLDSFMELHATTLKQHMEEQKCNQQAEVRTNPDVMYIEQLIKQKEEMAKNPDNLAKKHPWSAQSPRPEGVSDLELLSSHQDLNIIDPVSKRVMAVPVRHSKCGHVYDRDSIVTMIKANSRKGFRCPYMGCACREPIKERNLQPALDYAEAIEKRNNAISLPINHAKI